MIPERYQNKDEGAWFQWTSGSVESMILNLKKNIDNENVYINGCLVFALSFEIEGDSKNKKIWNCRTGWQRKGML